MKTLWLVKLILSTYLFYININNNRHTVYDVLISYFSSYRLTNMTAIWMKMVRRKPAFTEMDASSATIICLLGLESLNARGASLLCMKSSSSSPFCWRILIWSCWTLVLKSPRWISHGLGWESSSQHMMLTLSID